MAEGLCGPFNAEGFESEYEDYYVKSADNIKNDKYIMSVLGKIGQFLLVYAELERL